MSKLFILSFIGFIGIFNVMNYIFLGSSSDYITLKVDSVRNNVFQPRYNTSTDNLSLNDSLKTCLDCHGDMMQYEEKHPPSKKDCLRCHVALDDKHPKENVTGFKLKKKVPDLCYECHDPKNEEDFVHPPAAKGKCTMCHNVHSSPNMYILRENPVSKLCFKCHDLKIPETDMVHGAVSQGKCNGCHNPHQADNSKFIKSSKLDRVCKSCHKHIKKDLKKEFVHVPFKEKKCFKCHKPHSSKEAHLLDVKPKDLCLGCHTDFHQQLNDSKLIHGALNVGESCINCHSPHSSDHPKNLKKENVETCLTCHNEPVKTSDGYLDAIGLRLKEGNTIHGAITKEGCSTCHEPHASNEYRLLKQPHPSGRYVDANEDKFELCFRCHNRSLIEEKITSTATNFRDGDRNLHFLHVNRKKGRNCTICHNVHGSENKYMIKQSTVFGNWNMPIEYKYFENGGSCRTGCHDENRYERIVQDSLQNVLQDSLQDILQDSLQDSK